MIINILNDHRQSQWVIVVGVSYIFWLNMSDYCWSVESIVFGGPMSTHEEVNTRNPELGWMHFRKCFGLL